MTHASQIWFDATTIAKLRNHSPVGLSRVESSVLRCALTLPDSTTRMCTFNRYEKRIEEVSQHSIRRWLEQYGAAGKSGHGVRGNSDHFVRRFSRACERSVRIGARSAIARSKKAFSAQKISPACQPGDLFVISGSTWDSIDAATIQKLVVQQGLRIVAIIADMIPVLYPHQFQDAHAVNQFTQFADCIARYGALTLSISQSTKRNFEHFAESRGVRPQNSQVLYLGSEPSHTHPTPPRELSDGRKRDRFVLSVSTLQVRKNHQLLYQLWRRFAEEGRTDIPQLVLVGAPGWLTDDLQSQIAHDPLVRDSIRVLHQVNDAELAWLYQNCQFSLYPSLYEGWGLPIVESLSQFKPCLASNTSSMPEASQGLAVHLDPLDFRQWYDAIVHWSTYPEALQSESKRIQTRFRYRSWDDFSRDIATRLGDLAQSRPIARVA